MSVNRRQFLQATGILGLADSLPYRVARAAGHVAAAPAPVEVNRHGGRLLAAWQLPGQGYQAGVLQFRPGRETVFQPDFAVDLPSRPHGFMHLQGDEFLVLARRPGDWLMKLNLRTQVVSRTWQEEGSRLNGHCAGSGDFVYTTETDLLDGQGLVSMRSKTSLKVLQQWPTHGHDPHSILTLPAGALGINRTFLLVANGGIKSHADMGRARLPEAGMDSSLVALDLQTGEMLKQWTLDDSALSLRHLAFHPNGLVAVALQAQHEDPLERHAAPVLAFLGSDGLHELTASIGQRGYAGDVVATRSGFAVSCTHSHQVLQFDLAGRLLSTGLARAACALASDGNQLWLGQQVPESKLLLELDNHWLLLPV